MGAERAPQQAHEEIEATAWDWGGIKKGKCCKIGEGRSDLVDLKQSRDSGLPLGSCQVRSSSDY